MYRTNTETYHDIILRVHVRKQYILWPQSTYIARDYTLRPKYNPEPSLMLFIEALVELVEANSSVHGLFLNNGGGLGFRV